MSGFPESYPDYLVEEAEASLRLQEAIDDSYEELRAAPELEEAHADNQRPAVWEPAQYPLTPEEEAAVASKAAKRLLVTVEALQRVTRTIDLPTYKDKAK